MSASDIPHALAVQLIARDADRLDTTLLELRRELGDFSELRRADGREVGRVREEDRPAVSEPFVEVDLALRRLRLEVRSLGAESLRVQRWTIDETHQRSLAHFVWC